MSGKIYNESQVAEIIKRAVELETERSVSSGDTFRNALSLEELQKVAAESGIDPELIGVAAREIDARFLAESRGLSRPSAKVKAKEIVSEQWLDLDPSDAVMDDLVSELNYKFGTSPDDIGWWNDLFKSYAGKARVRKTSNSREWEYTDQWELYKTRVLLQKRNGRLRVRVSKKQNYGVDWTESGWQWWVMIPAMVVFAVTGGLMGQFVFGNVALGLLVGFSLSALSVPVSGYFSRKSVEKHKDNIDEIARELCEYAVQYALENPIKKGATSSMKPKITIEDVEIPIEDDDSITNPALKNRLKH